MMQVHFGDNGFPCDISPRGKNIIRNAGLVVTLADGTRLEPCGANPDPEVRTSRDGAKILEFPRLTFRGHEDFTLCLQYEIFPGGVMFCDVMFRTERFPPDIAGFELKLDLDFTGARDLRWSLLRRPAYTGGKMVQSSSPERSLLPGADRVLDGMFALAGFNVRNPEGDSFCAEFFLEGDCVLSHDPSDSMSSVTWNGGNPSIVWNFQKKAAKSSSGRPWQFRNRWGCVVNPSPRKRHFPPLVMYHFLDNFQHYPTDSVLQAIADAGADVLIMHENWRHDYQNGGVPYADENRFREIADFAHAHGIRILPYIRGNEDSVVDESAPWFPKYFKRNFDGLYIDYGGVFHFMAAPDEFFQNGRVLFRRYYELCRKRRDIVGKDGLILTHTGPVFSALGMTGDLVDGYVSGEGERGLLIRSREDYAYYSMLPACPGSMWTAAFPEYSGKRMAAFLASSGQMPHNALGVQFESSSLAEPPAPGVNDVYFRPLWRLWQLMRGETDLNVFHDWNSKGVFPDTASVSHYLMISGKKALCIFANLTESPVTVSPEIHWSVTHMRLAGKRKHFLRPDEFSPGKAAPFHGTPFQLPAYGLAAVCIGNFDFKSFEAPYPPLPAESAAYLRMTEEQKALRADGKDMRYLFIRVEEQGLPYEESMLDDLYDNAFFLSDGAIRTEVRPGEWIDLKALFGSGRKSLVLQSIRRANGEPFYNFADLSLGTERGASAYKLLFRNEIENDRSMIHFNVSIPEEP